MVSGIIFLLALYLFVFGYLFVCLFFVLAYLFVKGYNIFRLLLLVVPPPSCCEHMHTF